MGAVYEEMPVKSCTEQELHAWYTDLKEEAGNEHGHDAYSGTVATCSDLHILNEVFDTMEEASAFTNTVEKRRAIAVKVAIFAQPKASKLKKIDELKVKAHELTTEIRGYSALVILPRVKAGKSKTRGCECGSQIAVTHIRTVFCPVCNRDFLTTDTDLGKLANIQAKLDSIKANLKDLEAQARIEEIGWHWLVAWCAAS